MEDRREPPTGLDRTGRRFVRSGRYRGKSRPRRGRAISVAIDLSRTWVDDGRMSAVGAKVITPVGVASERKAEGNCMAARGSGGLLLCVALLPAMPSLAATRADRSACAASADKADVGGAASSRIIDDASEQVADRVKAFKNGAAAPSKVRITTARLPTTARPSSSARRTPPPLRTGARHTRARRTTSPTIADCGHKLAKLKQAYHGGRLWRRGSDANLLHSIAAQKPRISSRPPESRSMSYRIYCYSSWYGVLVSYRRGAYSS